MVTRPDVSDSGRHNHGHHGANALLNRMNKRDGHHLARERHAACTVPGPCDSRDSLGPRNHVGELKGIMQQHAKFSQEMTERPFPLFDTERVW